MFIDGVIDFHGTVKNRSEQLDRGELCRAKRKKQTKLMVVDGCRIYHKDAPPFQSIETVQFQHLFTLTYWRTLKLHQPIA